MSYNVSDPFFTGFGDLIKLVYRSSITVLRAMEPDEPFVEALVTIKW